MEVRQWRVSFRNEAEEKWREKWRLMTLNVSASGEHRSTEKPRSAEIEREKERDEIFKGGVGGIDRLGVHPPIAAQKASRRATIRRHRRRKWEEQSMHALRRI